MQVAKEYEQAVREWDARERELARLVRSFLAKAGIDEEVLLSLLPEAAEAQK